MLFKIISCIIKLYERGFTMAKLDNFLIQLFHEGNCLEMYKVFGAHLEENDGDKGVRFSVYAPHAKSVQVVGDFNNWNGEEHYMERYTDGGIFTLFIPHINTALRHLMVHG